MKQQRHIQTTRTLLSRFRYWGRKSYAAFASMGREFQIGHLHINVVDVALRKQNAAQTIPYHTFMTFKKSKTKCWQALIFRPTKPLGLPTWPTARRFMPPRMRLPSHVLRTNSICVPSSTPSPADARRTVNGVHNPLTTRRKPKSTISFPLKNVSDRQNTMKPRTSTVSPSSPAAGNLLPNRLPNFVIQSAICGDIRRFNFALRWVCSTKKNCVLCMKLA